MIAFELESLSEALTTLAALKRFSDESKAGSDAVADALVDRLRLAAGRYMEAHPDEQINMAELIDMQERFDRGNL